MDEIRFFMEESLISVEPTASIREAAQKMRHHSISSILIGESGNYTGILTDTDLTRKFAAKNLDSNHTLVSMITNNPIITLDADHLMEEAYECMRKKNIRHLGVIEKDEMVGIISIKDFANYYHNKYCNETEEKGEIQYFMKDSVLSIEAEETVLNAVKKMAQHKAGCLVVSEAGKASMCTIVNPSPVLLACLQPPPSTFFLEGHVASTNTSPAAASATTISQPISIGPPNTTLSPSLLRYSFETTPAFLAMISSSSMATLNLAGLPTEPPF